MSPDATGQRTLHDSRGNRLDVRWRTVAEKVLVNMDYLDAQGRTYWTSAAELTERLPRWSFTVPPAGNQLGRIELTAEDGEMVLGGDLPVSAYGSFREEIARWQQPGQPDEEGAPSPPERGRGPGRGGMGSIGTGSKSTPAGSILRNPACPEELLRVLSVRPAAPAPLLGGSLLGFVLLPHPEELPFYTVLSQLRTEPDGWPKMIAAAVQFAASDPAFVPSLASLDTPASAYPFLVSQIRSLQGEVSLEEILKVVDTFLFAFGAGPLDAYLASDSLKTTEARVWQSLFAVALGAPARPPLPDELVLVLRVDHFLRDLQRELLEAPPSPLTSPEGRGEVLGATVLLPQGVVPIEPACATAPPPPPPPPLETGWVKALGVGDLTLVYQCLKGYSLGEVAHVISVMERERLELSARELDRSEEVDELHQSDEAAFDDTEEKASRSGLRNELEDVVAAEALCSQYNDLTQTYDGTKMTLSGSWQGSDGLKQRSDREARDLAEALTRRAASRVARTVTEARVRRRLFEQERIDARDIDNRMGTGPLVGIYRWLLKIYELTARHEGKRLVAEFEIADPAAEFLNHIRNLYGVPLARPKPPADYEVFSWEDVTAENYLFLASLYGIEVAPPPPATIELLRAFQSQPPLFQADLEVPEGYNVASGSFQYLLGDVSDNLVGYVGTVQVSYPNTPPPAILGLLSTPPSGGGSGGGTACPALADPFAYPQVPYKPVQATQALDSLAGATGKVPVLMLSTATWFSATVSLSCALPAGSELLTAWQVRTYDALVEGYLRSLERYEAEIRARIGADAAGKRRIERRQLRLRAFEILLGRRAPTAPPPPESGCLDFFERAFAWDEMTYAFHAWPPPAETCGPDPGWRGQALIYAEEDDLFERFLRAGSARALVPVRPGWAAAVLFYLHFGLPWPGVPGSSPAAEPDLPVLADLRTPAEDRDSASWCLEIPTSMPVLQAGGELPAFPCPMKTAP